MSTRDGARVVIPGFSIPGFEEEMARDEQASQAETEAKIILEIRRGFFGYDLAGTARHTIRSPRLPQSKRRGGGRRSPSPSAFVPVLSIDRDIRLRAGRITGITGPSGCGKSTLLRTLLLRYMERERRASANRTEDVEVQGAEAEAGIIFRCRDIALMEQGGYLFPGLSVFENVSLPFPHQIRRSEIVRGKVEEALSTARASSLVNKPVSTLSGGEYRRVLLARSLARRPDLLLLDEPAANLDERNKREVLTGIRHYTDTHLAATLWVSHGLHAMLTYADEIFVFGFLNFATDNIADTLNSSPSSSRVSSLVAYLRPHLIPPELHTAVEEGIVNLLRT